MRRDSLETAWPLVLRHFEAVADFLDTPPTARRRKVSRRRVLEDCRETRNVRIVAAKHHVSPSLIREILVRALKVARARERGRRPRPRQPPKTQSVRLTAVPASLVRDIDAWAQTHGQSRCEGVNELLKVGLEVASKRAQRQALASHRQHVEATNRPSIDHRGGESTKESVPHQPAAQKSQREKRETPSRRSGTIRTVPADFTLFDEAIEAFRPGAFGTLSMMPRGREAGTAMVKQVCFLSDMILPDRIACPGFTLLRTTVRRLHGRYAAMLTPVMLEEETDRYTAHGLALAFSALVAFTASRPTRSPRNNDHWGEEFTEEVVDELAMSFPVVSAGPGMPELELSSNARDAFAQRLREITTVLKELQMESYRSVFRAIRLVQLAHQAVREDFALAHYLLISAIEVVAQVAVPESLFPKEHQKEGEFKATAEGNELFRAVYEAYTSERDKQRFLKRRFVRFVNEFCPPTRWSELTEIESEREAVWKEWAARLGADIPSFRAMRRSVWNPRPDELPPKAIQKMIENLYDYRSMFTHEGEGPPHMYPDSRNDYFDVEFTERPGERIIVPVFRLLAFITQQSILSYARKLHRESEQQPPA